MITQRVLSAFLFLDSTKTPRHAGKLESVPEAFILKPLA